MSSVLDLHPAARRYPLLKMHRRLINISVDLLDIFIFTIIPLATVSRVREVRIVNER